MTLTAVLLLPVVGLLAGLLGGLLGVGGSIIMIPALVLLFGQERTSGWNQHLYQAAAMAVNVAVALPAAWRHSRAGAVMPRVLWGLIPAALVGILLGVWISNLWIFSGKSGALWLQRGLGGFCLYVVYANLAKLRQKTVAGEAEGAATRITATRASAVGTTMGLIAGLLGIGGGAIAVPLQQVFLRLPLRNCIANSAATICITAGFGALYKNLTLAQHHASIAHSGLIIACLTPTAMAGGFFGARLTHSLPLRSVRIVFILLMAIVAMKLLLG